MAVSGDRLSRSDVGSFTAGAAPLHDDLVEVQSPGSLSQQTLDAWRPIRTGGIAAVWLVIVGLVHAVGGILWLVLCNDFAVEERYTDGGALLINLPRAVRNEDVFLGFRITHFYLSYASVATSRSLPQLRGESVKWEDTASCGDWRGPPDWPAVPCGALPRSVFNDTYEAAGFASVGIAPAIRRRMFYRKFAQGAGDRWLESEPFNRSLPGGGENERFMLWMDGSARSEVTNAASVCRRCSIADAIAVNVTLNYDRGLFAGERFVRIWVGDGRRRAVGAALAAVGTFMCVAAAAIALVRRRQPAGFGLLPPEEHRLLE